MSRTRRASGEESAATSIIKYDRECDLMARHNATVARPTPYDAIERLGTQIARPTSYPWDIYRARTYVRARWTPDAP